jgi:hypothetical protein
LEYSIAKDQQASRRPLPEQRAEPSNAKIATRPQRRPVATNGPGVTRNNKRSFYPKNESYQTIVFRGREYSLTPQAGAIVRVLYEAGEKPIAKADIQSKTKCGKIADSFRSLDGPQVWRKLINVTKGRKGFYSLAPQAFSHSQ